MAMKTPKMGGRSLAIMFGGSTKPKEEPEEADAEEAGETYEVTQAQLDELEQNGSVTLEGGCTLKLTGADEAEAPTEETETE